MLDLIERKQDELDRLTVAIAQGYGISMSTEYAAKWQAEHTARRSRHPKPSRGRRGRSGGWPPCSPAP